MQALIVSHNQVLIRYLSAQLSSKNIDVLIAANNKTALSIIELKRPWIVFSEVLGSDIEALAIFRAIEKSHPEISVIAISKSFDSKEAMSLLRRGLRDYIAIPVERKQSIINNAIKRARVRAMGFVAYMSKHDELELQHDTISRELSQLQEDQEAGRYVQLKLFPKNPIQLGCFEFSHRIFPSLYLSGDFIDYFPLDQSRSFFYFADVSGHGASSAFITMMLKTISHRWVNAAKESGHLRPSDYIRFINTEMLNMQLGKHMTLFCGILDEDQSSLDYSLAAHYPKPCYRNGGLMHHIEETALPVGVFEHAEYPDGNIKLDSDFVLYLFSDGIMEVIKGSSLKRKEAILLKALSAHGQSLDSLCSKFSLSDEQDLLDDIGMLMVRFLPPSIPLEVQ